MKFHDLLNINNVYIDAESKSKTSVLQNLSATLHACYPELDSQKLFDAFWERERLGSTAIGHGILIPHVSLPYINKTYACFIRLQNPVDFDADDKQPVDLIFGLASAADAADQHLQTLSRIVSVFSEADFRSSCRAAISNNELYNILTTEPISTI